MFATIVSSRSSPPRAIERDGRRPFCARVTIASTTRARVNDRYVTDVAACNVARHAASTSTA
jgi:hypothetical protein